MVTIVDVAKAAGVAPSTVSYVLTGKRPISPDTRRQVEQSIRQLGYRRRGQRAARGRTNVLALLAPLYPDVNLPGLTRFVSATMVAARARGFDLLLLTHDGGVSGLREAVSAAAADALIVMEAQADDPRIPVLMTFARPSVLVGMPGGASGLPCVDADFGAAANSAVTHLADLGHQAVGLVGWPPSVYTRGGNHARRFVRAFMTTAKDRHVRGYWRPCGNSAAGAEACVDTLFADDPAITALVVENEAALHGVLTHLKRRGRRVPEDISVVAVCPDETAERYPVRLTSVMAPTTELGELAVRLALAQLDGEAMPTVRLLAPRLTPRESTVAAPALSSGL